VPDCTNKFSVVFQFYNTTGRPLQKKLFKDAELTAETGCCYTSRCRENVR